MRGRRIWLWIQVVDESNLDSIRAWNTKDCNGEKMVIKERERERIMRDLD